MAARLGERIVAVRKKRGWTQAELAGRLAVEPETVSRFERGATSPSLATLEKIAATLRVGIGELLTETSIQADDQALTISAWLSDLGEADRIYVVALVKRTCEHLRRS